MNYFIEEIALLLFLIVLKIHYRIIVLREEPGSLLTDFAFVFFFVSSSTMKHFHNRSVSSAPADTTVSPSGDIARCKTRAVWPENKGCHLSSLGYLN